MLEQDLLKKQAMNILRYNLKDNVNSYIMHEDGTYTKKDSRGVTPFNVHKEFYNITREIIEEVKLF